MNKSERKKERDWDWCCYHSLRYRTQTYIITVVHKRDEDRGFYFEVKITVFPDCALITFSDLTQFKASCMEVVENPKTLLFPVSRAVAAYTPRALADGPRAHITFTKGC